MPTSQMDGNWFTEFEKNNATAFSLQIKRKLHEEQTPHQHISIYSTEKLGVIMALNGTVTLTENESFIHHEMMVHPALFSHAHPQKIAIIGSGDCGILREVLKHRSVTEAWQIEKDSRITQLSEEHFPSLCGSNHDPRAHFYFGNTAEWIAQVKPGTFDVIIATETTALSDTLFKDYLTALHPGGTLIQQSTSAFQLALLKMTQQHMQSAGFLDVQTLTFPAPTISSGWRIALIAKKQGTFKRVREKDIFNKGFPTGYYNFDIHKAALVLPEFMRTELTS